MSDSKRKTKIIGITGADSEKKSKEDANRKLRHKVKEKLKSGIEDLPNIREVSNVWGFEKDGKRYDESMTEKDMRK